ncbi:S-layer homology domain-containing protein [Anaerotignum lactatifermentans]|uniref:S-layer homology domain-containing protein n=1 Tax=Anaerotignum lactatifermentans TaxID=160404 RepID=UPI00262EDF6F|nr:S-layer homology domain-containing protein [Anaerotignum lactatifermentans]
MKKRTGKMISLSLAVAMAVTAAPVTALADENTQSNVIEASELTPAQSAGETGTGTTTEGDETGTGTTTEGDETGTGTTTEGDETEAGKEVTSMVPLTSATPVDEQSTETTLKSTETVGTAEELTYALKNAKDDEETTITLSNNIEGDFTVEKSKNIVLDLNGYTIKNTSDHTITNNGTLTIKDSSEKTGTIDNVSHARAAVWNNGIAILEGGTYTRSLENGIDEGNSGGNSYYNIVNHNHMTIKSGVTVEQDGNFSSMIENGWYDGSQNKDKESSVMIIEGGTFSGGLNTIKNDDYGELTINGGTFTNMAQAAFLNWNVATVNGGTFEANEGSNAIILNGYGNATMDKGELTINDGNFNTKQNDVNFIETMYTKGGYTSGTIEVNGGNIYGDIQLSDVTAGATLSITNGVTINGNITNGGVANVDVNGATINGKVSNTGNGSMAVTESKVSDFDEINNIIFIDSSKTDGTSIPNSNIGDAVAMIGATPYDTFDAAITAAKSGQTIRLMKNVEVDHAVTIPAGVTLDGGKNTTITLTTKLDKGAFITAGGDNVTIRNITINTNGNAKHGVQFYCVKDGEMDKVTVNGGYYTSVIVNGAEATIKNSTLNLDDGKGYANIEFAVGKGVTTVPKVTIENVTVTPNRPVVYMDKTTFDRIQALSGTSSGITRDELNEQYVKGAFLYYNKDGSITPNPDTLPTITFNPTEGSIADSAKKQKINISGHLDSLPTASRSGYRLDGWYTEAEGGEKITTDTLFTKDTTVYAQWSKKSSSSSRYDGYITIINPKNGEVSVSDDWAYEDDKITLTITPDDGYEVDKIEIVDDEGDKIDAKKVDDEDNKYTFRMANCDVTVTVTFKEEGKTTEDTDKEEDKDDEETTELNFTDVKETDWFFKGVEYVVDKDIMSGVSENEFAPSGKLTRAMLVQMLYNMESRPACDAENAFMDVPVGQWYTDAVIWANDAKIVSGMGEGLFAPNMEITREQMVAMLYNYAKYKGYDVTASTDLSKFADNASVSTWAQPAMQWAVAEGYISGMGDNQLAPQGTATRAEIASVIMRFMEATAESAETAE